MSHSSEMDWYAPWIMVTVRVEIRSAVEILLSRMVRTSTDMSKWMNPHKKKCIVPSRMSALNKGESVLQYENRFFVALISSAATLNPFAMTLLMVIIKRYARSNYCE